LAGTVEDAYRELWSAVHNLLNELGDVEASLATCKHLDELAAVFQQCPVPTSVVKACVHPGTDPADCPTCVELRRRAK
jgi:hypothetical protein